VTKLQALPDKLIGDPVGTSFDRFEVTVPPVLGSARDRSEEGKGVNAVSRLS
jgi:hypothetical protein